MTNSEIVAQLPTAKKLYRKHLEVVCSAWQEEGRITFDDVRTIAMMVTSPETVIHQALLRVIERENCITLEYK